MTQWHRHYCVNRARGCTESFRCDALPIEDDCGLHCSAYGDDSRECDECGAGKCEDCGCLTNLNEGHEDGCEVAREVGAEEEDMRDGAAGSYEARQAAAQRVKR